MPAPRCDCRPDAGRYDAWNRLIQVSGRGTVDVDVNGNVSGTPDPWIIHYAYDAFGRLIATQRPWPSVPDYPNDLRTVRHYYDGARRIQDVNIDPIIGVVPPTQSSIPVEGSGTQVDPNPMINVYVARDYIYTPGYVDELQCMIDSTGEIEHVLQDGNYNVVGLLDGSADLLAQYVYDPYGSLVAGDIDVGVKSAVGHQGLFFDRLDANLQAQQLTVLSDGQGGFEPPVVGIYHNRNRTYHPGLGRFLQKDPNGTAVALAGGSSRGAGPSSGIAGTYSMRSLYGDGMSIYAYLGGNPTNQLDPMGTFTVQGLAGSMLIQGFLSGMVQGGLSQAFGGSFSEGFDAGFAGGFLGGGAGYAVSAFACSSSGLFASIASNPRFQGAIDGGVDGFASSYYGESEDLKQALANAAVGAIFGYALGDLADTIGARFTACFVEGTTVLTPDGPVEVQDLQIGDLVVDYIECDPDDQQLNEEKTGVCQAEGEGLQSETEADESATTAAREVR